MAAYKVIQDIEAEDKLVGPLSLRQFIYAAIAVVSAFIAFKLAFVSLFLIAPFLPVIVLFGVLAVPFGHDQPSEVWLLARFRFFIKPHLRIWNKDGNINLVTITAPKAVQKPLTKDFTATEAQSRLKALANTIDSRGWSIKNVNVSISNESQTINSDDRLVDPSAQPQPVPQADVTAADDIMDASNNPTAQKLDKMVEASTQLYKEKAAAGLTNPQASIESSYATQSPVTPDYWFMNDQSTDTPTLPGYKKFGNDKVVSPHAESDEIISQPVTPADTELLKEIEANKKVSNLANSHLHVVQPLGSKPPVVRKAVAPQVTPPTNPGIINLALANKDNWTVATIARQAEQAKQKEQSDDEVVISLH